MPASIAIERGSTAFPKSSYLDRLMPRATAIAPAKRPSTRRRQNGRDNASRKAKTKIAALNPPSDEATLNGRPTLAVDVIWSDLAGVKSDVVLVGHYTGVLPQRAELALDRLVSGTSAGDGSTKLLITEMSKRGAIRGDLGEVSLFPGPDGRLGAVAGMGRPGTFRRPQLRRLARTVAQVVGLLPRHKSLASVVIGSGEGNIPLKDAVEGFLGGLIEALDADPDLTLDSVTFVEQHLDRAMDVLRVLKVLAADFQRRTDEDQSRTIVTIQTELRDGIGGKISADFGCAMLLASLGMPVDAGGEKDLLTTLLARLPADVQTAVRDRLLLKSGRTPLDAAALREQAMSFRLNELRLKEDRQRNPVRVAFSRSGDDIRSSAITNSTTVSERVMQRRAGHAERAAERLYKPVRVEFETNTRRLRRLIVHPDIRETLDGDDPLVVEVDRSMCLVPWEMLPVGQGEVPLGVHRPIARQLRTLYSPRPFELPRSEKNQLKALVIGDPAEGQYELKKARDEALKVGKALKESGVTCTVLIGPPEEGTGAGQFEVPPAGYYEVVDLLLSGEFDIVHFSGHAFFDPEQADRSGWVFNEGILTASDLEGMERPPRLVFANACLSGQLTRSEEEKLRATQHVKFVAGLADQFFALGTRDYIGAAWEIGSEPAAKFARTFYQKLLGGGDKDGLTLGEALQYARRTLFEQNKKSNSEEWSIWAAYQHYGDPTTSFGVTYPNMPSG